eukprot:2330500-Rhodomonas_salina.1
MRTLDSTPRWHTPREHAANTRAPCQRSMAKRRSQVPTTRGAHQTQDSSEKLKKCWRLQPVRSAPGPWEPSSCQHLSLQVVATMSTSAAGPHAITPMSTGIACSVPDITIQPPRSARERSDAGPASACSASAMACNSPGMCGRVPMRSSIIPRASSPSCEASLGGEEVDFLEGRARRLAGGGGASRSDTGCEKTPFPSA